MVPRFLPLPESLKPAATNLKYLIGTGRQDDSLRWKRENSNAQPNFMPLLW